MDIGTLTGTIAIEDQLSSALEVSSRKITSYVTDFTKSFGPMGTAALGTATAVVGGVTAMTAAIVALGMKGSDVNDLKDSIDKFAGGTSNANKIIDEMQKGVLGTVDKMSLMTTASKLLSTGTIKNATDFGTLSSTASILANRGFGSTEEMMNKLSSAMTTGRDKGLKLAGVNVDLEGAQRKYADSIGISSKELTDAEKLMVNQKAIMDAMNTTVKEAGEQHRDFADNIAAASTFVKDFITDLSSQVAASPAVTEAMDKIGEALGKVFGGGTSGAIDIIMKAIDGFAKGVSETVDFVMEFAGIFKDSFGTVEESGSAVASMFESVWSVVQSLMPVVLQLAKLFWMVYAPLWEGMMKVLPLVAALFKGLAFVIDEVSKAVGWLLDKITGVVQWVKDSIAKVPFVAKAFEGLAGMVNLTTPALVDCGKEAKATSANTEALTTNTDELTNSTTEAGNAAREQEKKLKLQKEALEKSKKAAEDAAKAQLAFLDAVDKATDKAHLSVSGLNALRDTSNNLRVAFVATTSSGRQFEEVLEDWIAPLDSVQLGMEQVFDELGNAKDGNLISYTAEQVEELHRNGQHLAGTLATLGPAAFSGLLVAAPAGISSVTEKSDEATLALSDLADAFVRLGQASGGTLGGIIGGFGQMIVMADAGQKAAAQSKINQAQRQGVELSPADAAKSAGNWGYGSVLMDSGAGKADKMAAGTAIAMNTIGGIGDMKKALDSRKTSDRLMGSAMAGAKIGSSFGPYGVAIGAAAGLVIGLIKGKPEWAKAADEIGRDLGVTVSDELGKAIGEDIKKLGGRAQGIAVNLAGIIAEGGGLSDENFDKFAIKFSGAMDMVKSGQLDLASGTKIVEENWATFAEAGTSAFGVLDKDLVSVIKSTKELGIESKAVTEYLGAQGQAAVSHFGNALSIGANAILTQKELLASGTATAEELATVQGIIGATTIKTQEAADAIAAGVAGSFDAMIQSGMSFSEAIAEIEPAIESLNVQMAAAGLVGSDAFLVLQEQVALYSGAISGPALTAVEELSAGMVSLSNMGLMNQDTFAGLSGQITSTFSELVAQGNDSNVVMIGMRDSIQRMWEEQQEFGYTTDEATQALIDQAVAEGIVGEKHKSVTDQMLDATNRMVTVLEGVADALGAKIPTAAQTGAKGVQTALDGIKAPNLTVGVSYSDPGFTPRGSQAGLEGYAGGTDGFRDFGEGTPVMLHGLEAVVPYEESKATNVKIQADNAAMMATSQSAFNSWRQGLSATLSQAANASDNAERARLGVEEQQRAMMATTLAEQAAENQRQEAMHFAYQANKMQSVWEQQESVRHAYETEENMIQYQAWQEANRTAEELAESNRNQFMSYRQAKDQDVQYLAGGGEVLPFPSKGTDTVPAMLTPGERVLSVQQNEKFEQNIEGPSNEDVVIAVNSLRNDLNSKLPRALARSLHAGLVGLRTA